MSDPLDAVTRLEVIEAKAKHAKQQRPDSPLVADIEWLVAALRQAEARIARIEHLGILDDHEVCDRQLAAAEARIAELETALVELCDANEQHSNAPPDWRRLNDALDVARAAVRALRTPQQEGE